MHADATVTPRIGLVAALLRGATAALLGLITGAALNMGLLYAGMAVFPAPEGVDISKIETINENIHRYSVGQLLVPFAAHALGTLVGAFIAASIAATPHSRRRAALLVGFFFLLGGIDMVFRIPNAPLWFDVLDLGIAYIPMAVLGWRLAVRGKGRT